MDTTTVDMEKLTDRRPLVALLIAMVLSGIGSDDVRTEGSTRTEEQRVNGIAQAPPNAPPMAAPGQLIDLGGWRVHLNCTGQRRASQPTVILEAGAGGFSVDWSLVQPDVARFARVCSYDRAGLGWSELGPRPRTLRQVVWELHTLLGKAGERPPYVLVAQGSR